MQNAKLRNSTILNFKFLIFNSRRTGFTLIEILIVLFIISVILTLAGTFIHKGMDNLRLNTLTKEISATLRYARSRAIAEKKQYSFIVKEKENVFALYSDTSPVIYKTLPEDLEINFKNNDRESVRIDFFPQGNSTGGVIELKNRKGMAWFISANKVSGRVEVKKSNE